MPERYLTGCTHTLIGRAAKLAVSRSYLVRMIAPATNLEKGDYIFFCALKWQPTQPHYGFRRTTVSGLSWHLLARSLMPKPQNVTRVNNRKVWATKLFSILRTYAKTRFVQRSLP